MTLKSIVKLIYLPNKCQGGGGTSLYNINRIKHDYTHRYSWKYLYLEKGKKQAALRLCLVWFGFDLHFFRGACPLEIVPVCLWVSQSVGQ